MSWKPLSAACAVSVALFGAIVPPTVAAASPAVAPRASTFAGPGPQEAFRAKVVRNRGLVERLGKARTGGVFRNPAGEPVVAVTDDAAAQQVSAAGGVPVRVARSTATLETIKREFDGTTVAGISWGVDPSENRVSVTYDDQVPAAEVARLRRIAARHGSAVRLEASGGRLRPAAAFTSGGQGIQSGAKKCSLGFNIERVSSGSRYFLTAGHCIRGNHLLWNKAADGTRLGKVAAWNFPGSDWALVSYDNPDVSAYGTVWVDGTEKQITRSDMADDGQEVERVGTISNDHVGAVLEPSVDYTMGIDGVTYRFQNGIKTSLCGLSGDSGGPLYSGTTALGLFSAFEDSDARPGTCNNGVSDARTYYMPVQAVLNHFGGAYRVY